MSDKRQLKSYRVILSAHQHELDQLSIDLNGIRADQADIQAKIVTLQHRRDAEGFAATLEAAPFVASFLQAISAQQTTLYKQLVELNEKAEELEDQVRSKFAELQSWRVTCDRLQARIDDTQRHKDSAELDEVARTIFTLSQDV